MPAGTAIGWELVDIAAPPGTPAIGVAVTVTDADGIARAVALTPPLPELVRELVAALRRTDAIALALSADEPAVHDGLRCEDVEHVGRALIVRF